MLETLAAGLILAAVSALTYVAYKHQSGYKKLASWILGGLCFLAVVFLMTAYGSILSSASALREKLASADSTTTLESARYSIESLHSDTRTVGLVLLVGGAITGHLLFLAYLPSILKSSDQQNQ